MPSIKRLRAPVLVTFGVVMAAVTFAGPANAADAVYPPRPGTEVLGTTETVPETVPEAAAPETVVEAAPVVEVAGVTEVAGVEDELAFTGANALGVGAFGGLLLVGGTALVLTGKRRKSNI